MKQILFIAFGSAVGGVLRYVMQMFFVKNVSVTFPFGTLAVNIIGCFLIGLFFAMSEKEGMISADTKLFLMTGLCGGFTTYSAFALENNIMLRDGNILNFGLYTAASLVLGIGATYLGMQLIK